MSREQSLSLGHSGHLDEGPQACAEVHGVQDSVCSHGLPPCWAAMAGPVSLSPVFSSMGMCQPLFEEAQKCLLNKSGRPCQPSGTTTWVSSPRSTTSTLVPCPCKALMQGPEPGFAGSSLPP